MSFVCHCSIQCDSDAGVFVCVCVCLFVCLLVFFGKGLPFVFRRVRYDIIMGPGLPVERISYILGCPPSQ